MYLNCVLFLFVSISVLDKFCDHLWTEQLKIELRADIIYRFTDLLPLLCVRKTIIPCWMACSWTSARCRWHLLMTEHLAKSIYPVTPTLHKDLITPSNLHRRMNNRRRNKNRIYDVNKKNDWRIEKERTRGKKGTFFRWRCCCCCWELLVCLQNII